MIDITKKYQTDDGRLVRLYTDEAGGDCPIHGAIWDEEKKYWYTWQWTNDGQSYFFKKTPSDLVEVKEKEIVTRWINVYGYPLTLSMHETKEEADKYDFVKRISCTKIEIEYEEGEGL